MVDALRPYNDPGAGPVTAPPERSRWRGLVRYRFTLVLLAALVAAAVATGTVAGPLSRDLLQRIGFAPRDLWTMDVLRLFVSALVTEGRWVFPAALSMVALAVGAVEHRHGSMVAALTFWASHLWTLAVVSVATWLSSGLPMSEIAGAVLRARDVGPSAGYFGAIGVALCSIEDGRRRALATLLVLVWLGVDLAGPTGVSLRAEREADIAHLVAFATGWVVAFAMVSRERSGR